MPRIALVTARAAHGTDYDMPPLLTAFAALGAEAAEVDWDDAGVDWSTWNAALLRSPWDYTRRYPAFLNWARNAALQTRLVNPLDVIEWNTDKHYLGELAARGVPVVPTHFVEPGDDPVEALAAAREAWPTARELVIKPTVGAGSRDTQRHAIQAVAASRAHLARLLGEGRSVMVQPYLARVDDAGETALIHLDGAFSHAIRKGALLRRGGAATNELYAREDITPRVAAADELALAAQVLAATPFADRLAYARVDLIRADDGTPRLLELELVEPSLFFAHAPGSAERCARAILAHC